MANTDFRVLLKAVLDKSGINTELKEVQDIINKHSVDIVPELKTASLRNQMKSVSKDIANDFNKTFGTSLTGNDIYTAYVNQTKRVVAQNKIVEQSFTDLRKNAYQSIGDKSPELQKMADMYKQESIEADKVAVSASKINQAIASGVNEAKIEQLTSKFKNLGLSTEEINTRLFGVNSAFDALKNSSDNTSLIANAKLLDSEYAKVNNQIKQTSAEMGSLASKSQRLSSLNSFNTYIDNNTSVLKKFKTEVNDIRTALNDPELTKSGLKNVNAQIKELQVNARNAGEVGKTLGDSFTEAGKKFASWITVSGGIMLLVSNLKSAVSELKDVNTILTEISKTNESLSKSDLTKLGSDAFDTASKYGRKASDYLLGVQEASRAGYTNAEGMAELSTLAQSAGDMTSELANQYLIATDAAYKLQGQTEKLNEVLDGQNYITNRNALSMSDLAEATKVSASQAESSGVAINEMTAAVGTMIATTQQGGDIAGRAFKGILMNLQQVKGTVDEETGEVIDEDQLTKYEKAANDLGVKLKEVKNGYLALRDPMEVLKELSKAYTSLQEDDARRANLINAVGGKIYHVVQKCATRMILIAGNASIGQSYLLFI